MTNYILNYFLVSVFVFCGYGLYFLDSVSVLRINFVFFFVSVFPVGDADFGIGICVSVFW